MRHLTLNYSFAKKTIDLELIFFLINIISVSAFPTVFFKQKIIKVHIIYKQKSRTKLVL